MPSDRPGRSLTQPGYLEPLCLLAVLCLLPLPIYANGTLVLVLLAALGSLAIVGAALTDPWRPMFRSAARTTTGVFVIVGLALATTIVGAFHVATLFAPQFAVPVGMTMLAAGGVWFIAFRTDGRAAVRWLAWLLMVLVLVTTSYAYLEAIADPTIDVLDLHQAATDALLNAENPYAVARAPDSSLFAEDGAVVDGYTYPPITMVTYVLSGLVLGDARWASVLAVGATVLLVVAPWVQWTPAIARVRMAAGLLLASLPGFGLVTFFGWTEPISLPLLAAAAHFWRSRPVISWVALGLALATKQYFVLALPLLLLWPDEWRWRRFAVAVGVAFATMLPFLLIDASALLDAMLGNTAFSGAPRIDSSNLVHLGIVLPRWLATGAAIALGVWLGKRGGEGFRFMLALTAVLCVAFFLGIAAFRNYWFLVAGMAVIALAARYPAEAQLPSADQILIAP